MRSYINQFCLIMLSAFLLAFTSVDKEPTSISLPVSSSDRMRLAAQEIQKYVYQRTGRLLPVKQVSNDAHIRHSIRLVCDDNQGTSEEFALERDGSNLLIRGGSDLAVLYGAYQYAELLGVRFTLHGDVLPDNRFEGSLWQCGKGTYRPLFNIRGLLPFHDFPEGPDLWDEDMYKACMTQMAKMKMNFFSLHTYPYIEPNVWIGLPKDVDASGNVTQAYPTTLANTARRGDWGYSAMNTRDYSCGAAFLFKDSIYASPLVRDALPMPAQPQQMNAVFNRTGELFDRSFSFGKRLGLRFCVGVETPLSIPHEVNERIKAKHLSPQSRETRELVYEGIFSRIQKRHPLDYFWLWTPEEWTWGTPSAQSIENTIEDVQIARSVLSKMGNPFGFGLSGWVLGPPNNPKLFDKYLPETDFMASLSRLCGQERIDLGYKQLPDSRTKMPILWLEDDPALTTPQLWAGRMQSDIAESHAAGCQGIIGNFWRTRSIAPNIIAFAQACWEQDEWNIYKNQSYEPAPLNDIRIGGVGTNYFRYIKGTEDQYLYNTQRYDLKGFKVKVPNGRYRVTFLFCETKYDKPGERVFSLNIQDTEKLSDIDVFARVGRDSIYTLTSGDVEVNNYTLNIEVVPGKGPTFMSGFKIEGMTADANQVKGTPYKRCINVGGGLYKDFEADLSERAGNKPTMPRDFSATSFYKDYALHEFGSEIGEQAAAILESLDGNIGNEGHLNFRMPRPASWITGPGVIRPNESDWADESTKYAFVDSLYALRESVKGKGNLARYDYWLHTFSYLRAMGHLGCMRGQLDKSMKALSALPKDKQKMLLEQEIIPLRIALSRGWEEMMGHLLQTVSTSGEVGTVINLESQTRKTYAFLTKHDKQITTISGKELPKEAQLSTEYSFSPRLVVLNERTVIEAGEPYRMEVIMIGKHEQSDSPVLKYRPLGKKKFKSLPMKPESSHVFSVQLPEEAHTGTLEYYITTGEKSPCVYPATAPDINATWISIIKNK